MKPDRYALRLQYADVSRARKLAVCKHIVWRQAVCALPVCRLRAERGALPERMHTRIRPARSVNVYLHAAQRGQYPFQLPLNGSVLQAASASLQKRVPSYSIVKRTFCFSISLCTFSSLIFTISIRNQTKFALTFTVTACQSQLSFATCYFIVHFTFTSLPRL